MMGKAYRHLMRHESGDAQAGVPAISVTSTWLSLIIDLDGVTQLRKLSLDESLVYTNRFKRHKLKNGGA
jgi:hypothetical protein